jgi:hypothetical protein
MSDRSPEPVDPPQPAGGASWPGPTASLGRIARLKVLVTGLPGMVVQETVFDAPFHQVWDAITDFERSVPAFDPDVARLRIVDRHQVGGPDQTETLRIFTRQTWRALWVPAVLDMDLSPGWCWMVSRPQLYVIGMAAEPTDDGTHTRLAHAEGIALPAPRPLRPLLRPIHALSHWRHRRHLPQDLAGMHAFVATRSQPSERA